MLRPVLSAVPRSLGRSRSEGIAIAIVVALVSAIWIHAAPLAHASTARRVPAAHVCDSADALTVEALGGDSDAVGARVVNRCRDALELVI